MIWMAPDQDFRRARVYPQCIPDFGLDVRGGRGDPVPGGLVLSDSGRGSLWTSSIFCLQSDFETLCWVLER